MTAPTYLDSPRTHLEGERLVLNAHLTSRLGQRLGNDCAGADFASNVTVSGKLRAAEHTLQLEDLRIDRVDDDSTRTALNLALQLAPQQMPHSAVIDVQELLRKQSATAGGMPLKVDQIRIVSMTSRAGAVVVEFDMNLSGP